MDVPAFILDECMTAIRSEIFRAARLHGEQAMISPSLPDDNRLPILVEEVGEVARGMTYDNNQGVEHLIEELEQTAAMATSWAAALRTRIYREATS